LHKKEHHNCAVRHIKEGEIGGACSMHATFWSENLNESAAWAPSYRLEDGINTYIKWAD